MANLKSAIKRVKQAKKRTERNKAAGSEIKTAFRKAGDALAAKSQDAKDLILKAISVIDKAVVRGIVHRNTAARKKSRLIKKLAGPVKKETK